MTQYNTYDMTVERARAKANDTSIVLENDKAIVIYSPFKTTINGKEVDHYYTAYSKEIKGSEYAKSGLYVNSTTGDFKKCKKAFEKYSGFVRA